MRSTALDRIGFRPMIRELAVSFQKRPMPFLALAVLIAAFAICYASTFASLAAEWSRSDTYSHGYLVPWIALFLVWIRRDRLREVRRTPNWALGTALVLLGLAIKVLGSAAEATVIEGVSMIPFLAGALVLFGGIDLLKALLLPLLYLLFMIPVWAPIIDRLTPSFRHLSAWLGVHAAELLGIPAALDGFYIRLPQTTLLVAEACSGVNYLIAVTAVGIPLAWISFPDARRRVVLIVFGILVALLANALRVSLIAILLYAGIIRDTHGPGHVLQGLSVATMGYVGLFAGAWALSRFWPRPRPREGESRSAKAPPASSAPPVIGTALVLAVALLALFTWDAARRPAPVPLPRPLSSLPLALGPWQGGEGSKEAIPVPEIPGSQRLDRVYSSPSRAIANVLVLYVPDQSGGSELVGYRTVPLVGGLSVRIQPERGGAVEIRRSETRDRGVSTVTYAWYDIDGHVTVSPWRAKLRTAGNVLTRGTSNAALVAVRVVRASEDAPAQEPELRAFVGRLLDSLRSTLPGHARP